MKKKTLLLIDSNYLCNRAWYVHKDLSYEGSSTGVVFGFLRDIVELQEVFHPSAFVFCFDHGRGYRKTDYPGYKSGRPEKPQEFKDQVKMLRLNYLYELGYENVVYHKGYEADDLIAKLVQQQAERGDVQCTIVSADQDFYQCLGRNCNIYNPHHKRITTEESFSREWGVSPTQWIDVKAIAGCATDKVRGVDGVAEKTAAKFIKGTLSPGCKAFEAIVKGNKIWKRNKHLVRLPYPGLPDIQIREVEKVSAVDWEILADKLGMKSIRKKIKNEQLKGFDL